MSKITISKTKYDQLQRQAWAFQTFAAKFFELAVRDTVENVVKDFEKTNLYTSEFLRDLKNGLRRSSFAKSYAHKAATPRSDRVSQNP